MKKLGGPNANFPLNGTTSDSGGGGTGKSLHTGMDALRLCVPEEQYLVAFCSLHTLQLTLSNAMGAVIGKGGLEERNAAQAIHSIFDMQEAMEEFGLWQRHWKAASSSLGLKPDDNLVKVKKIAAPILTRWWTVGEAAKNIIDNLPVLLEMARNFRNANPSNSRMNKIASGVLSLFAEPIIVSDIKLISCFHDIFLNQHFNWLQKGDAAIGGTPGYLGRLMLVRYFLMHQDLKMMMKDGWKKGGKKMEPFLNSLGEDALNVSIPDPADPSGKRTTTGAIIQAKKINMFFEISFKILQKHYDIFCKELLFLSLYGEQHFTQIVAKVLLLQKNDFSTFEPVVIKSKSHEGREINLDAFASFVSERVDVHEQMTNNFHINKLKNCLPLLACECQKTMFLQFLFFQITNSPTYSPIYCFTSWQSRK